MAAQELERLHGGRLRLGHRAAFYAPTPPVPVVPPHAYGIAGYRTLLELQ
jgi:hypothetical protein